MIKHFDAIILAILTLLKTQEERATILGLGDSQNGKSIDFFRIGPGLYR